MLVIRAQNWNKSLSLISAILGLILSSFSFGSLLDYILLYVFDWKTGLLELKPQNFWLSALASIPFIIAANISFVVRAHNGLLEAGIKLPFKKRLYRRIALTVKDQPKLSIEQGEDLFFNLYARGAMELEILVDRKPNSSPIKDTLENLKNGELKAWYS
tara:strand:- start:819 stop:1295 length:477 start_codon:yes stop_codon:yes gene_type:complete